MRNLIAEHVFTCFHHSASALAFSSSLLEFLATSSDPSTSISYREPSVLPASLLSTCFLSLTSFRIAPYSAFCARESSSLTLVSERSFCRSLAFSLHSSRASCSPLRDLVKKAIFLFISTTTLSIPIFEKIEVTK